MNEDIFYSRGNHLFDHHICDWCGQKFLGFDSYADHVLEEHDKDVISNASVESMAAINECTRLGGCDYVPDKPWDGEPMWRCRRCGWLMFEAGEGCDDEG